MCPPLRPSGVTLSSRLPVLDGLRGYFLTMMMVHHLVFEGDTWLRHIHHASLGFVEDAQGFVFLSGFVVGLVYTKTLKRAGWEATRLKARSRVWELYKTILLTIAVLLLAAWFWPVLKGLWAPYLGPLLESPSTSHLAALSLLYQPAFGDVLPQYMLYLLVSPWLVRAFAQGKAASVLGCSVLLWGLTQLGLHHLFYEGLSALFKAVELNPQAHLHAYFNPLGWQVLFVVGLYLGWDFAPEGGGARALTWLAEPRRAWVWAALSVVLACAVLRVLHGQGAIPGPYADSFYRLFHRSHFSLVHLLNFVSSAYLLMCLLRQQGRVGRGLRTFFATRFFVFLGQHSLQVYAFHVIVVYAIIALDGFEGPLGEPLKWAIGLGAVGILSLAARYHQLKVAWQQHRKSEAQS